MLLPSQERQNGKTETEQGQEGSIRGAGDWQEIGSQRFKVNLVRDSETFGNPEGAIRLAVTLKKHTSGIGTSG
ncbi:hypothetical protein Q5P01_006126 [Channa striata]|uniref:Uncharacterized protein n=1 Tax=Channa striata TaxID=64152 RepID=A0AA88N8M1_CHASR|nr:hypothetical protein Q5P01_006126 [Channa striata]